jgi:hypothetical protein
MKIIQNRESLKVTHLSSLILNRLLSKGLIKIDSLSKKYSAEDIIKSIYVELLEQGISDYDVVTLAQERLIKDIKVNDDLKVTSSKYTDGCWRLEFRFGEKNYTFRKEDVIDLAVEAYRAEAERVLTKY